MKRKNFMYYLKQKLCGIVLVGIGVIAPLVCDGDATVSAFIIPLGLYIMFTKEKVMMF